MGYACWWKREGGGGEASARMSVVGLSYNFLSAIRAPVPTTRPAPSSTTRT